MKKTIVKTTIDMKKNATLQIMLLNRDIDAIKREVFQLVDSKKRMFSDFATEHDIENIGVEMEISPKGLYCNFVAINRFRDFELNDRDRLGFAELLGPNFIIVDEDFKDKVLGAFEGFVCTVDTITDFYENHFETFQALECLYEINGFRYTYLDDIEAYIGG